MFKTLKKSKGRVLSAVMSAVVTAGLLAASFPVSTSAATTVSVDTKKQYQTVRGFGGINLPEWISQGDMTDAQVQKAFGNGNDELGLTILRIYVSDDSNAWS
ncbi:MAG TPA: glucuronoarabinoxylan endo-1,4-beta-xylanase, partial [Ruminococcus flavefaciens]|nr:glucuronoarabinoxylan endo-1,4-beta-xylanase [Ruminococcus flavefaciens]